jgi:hypothetical protein
MGSRRLRGAAVTASVVAAAALLAAPTPGCGDRDEEPALKKKSVALESVPADVVKTASGTLKGVQLKEAWENLDREGKLHSYELRGRVPSTGKIREARVSPEGKVLEVE